MGIEERGKEYSSLGKPPPRKRILAELVMLEGEK